MYLKRKIDKYLVEWMNNDNKKPLVIKGPRQVGKTESIIKFAKDNYENYIYINFIEEPIYKNITENGYSVDQIVKNISLIDPSKIFNTKERTLIIFDEIQDYIEISTALKFFNIDGRFDVVCSGSLLGINYNRIESVSTGYKTDYEMHSLDFEEFLWAVGYDEKIRDDFLDKMINLTKFSSLEFNVYMNLFTEFVILGGMPDVLKDYFTNNSFEGTLEKQRQIIRDYKEDISKYASGLDKSRILNVFNHIPVQLAKDNKKYQLSQINKNARFREYRGVIEWLNDAGMINVCYGLNSLSLPLKGNYDLSNYKVYMKDTGLLIAELDEESQDDLRANKNLGVYKGALYENMVAEAFVKSGLELYYYKNKTSTLEQDFLLRSKNNIVPVEVKAGRAQSKSMKELITNDKYEEIEYGIKLSKNNIGYNNEFYTFPHFLSFLIKDFLKLRK